MGRGYVTAGRMSRLAGDLSDRDHAIVMTLAGVRLATGQQLERLHFGSGDTAARHCRRVLAGLVERRLLHRLERRVGGVRAGSAGYVYALAVAGQRLVGHSGVRRRPWTPGRPFLAHTIAITETYVRLVEANRAGRLELLSFVTEPGCWRTFAGPGGGRIILKPNALVRTAVPGFEDAWFIEVDRGTESATTLERKCELYGRYWSSGSEQAAYGLFPRVLWLVPDAGRRSLLESVARRQPDGAAELFRVELFDALVAVVAGDPS